jgi:tetratricopeptide (TPR) repeat protein
VTIGLAVFAATAAALGWRTMQRNADYHSAVGMWRKVIAQYPWRARAYFNLGYSLEDEDRWEEAARSFDQAFRTDSSFVDALNEAGICMARLGRQDEAIARYRQVLTVNPNLAQAHANLGNVLLDTRPAEAIAEYDEALRLEPNNPDVHFNLAAVLALQGRTAEAIPHLEESIRFSKSSASQAEAHNRLGEVLAMAGKLEEAILHYQMALKLAPDLIEAHRNLQAAQRGEIAPRD